ncbi:hypothetical protein HanXRQr2_Chr08g0346851 [Helianthus annuus]|uniref:DUF7731 domain-containing protein n=1 Tax=Helianthus annuus TaxID=4232 RepID=A0A251U6Z8_HELAN|nr:hypothetical protein HanXRQr2_Chr08g0346851 [Helianthus annuus]
MNGKTNPIYNVNLAPFIQRLSAYYCIYNESSNCRGNFNLTMEGWLNITESETRAFCDGGCLQHTHDVLQCVWYVLDDFKFENGATIKNINDTINIGCEKGFNGTTIVDKSDATKLGGMTIYALIFLALFYM